MMELPEAGDTTSPDMPVTVCTSSAAQAVEIAGGSADADRRHLSFWQIALQAGVDLPFVSMAGNGCYVESLRRARPTA